MTTTNLPTWVNKSDLMERMASALRGAMPGVTVGIAQEPKPMPCDQVCNCPEEFYTTREDSA